MPDMLVRLYDLPPLQPALERCERDGVRIRRALPPERPRLVRWMEEHYSFWISELEASFANVPVSCHVAVRDKQVVGFACHDAFAPNFFGPTGVAPADGKRGIGTALLLAALHAQRAQGYAYAIIGGVGPTDYYERAVGATLIAGSDPGPYADLLT